MSAPEGFHDAEKKELKAALREAQAREWDRLSWAIRRAIGSPYVSIEVEGIVETIREQAALVGPTPWGEVNFEFVRSRVYDAVYRDFDVNAIRPSLAEYVQARKLMDQHHNPDLFYRCEVACKDIRNIDSEESHDG